MSNLYRFCNSLHCKESDGVLFPVELSETDEHTDFEKFWLQRKSHTGYEFFQPIGQSQQTTKMYLDYDESLKIPVTDEIIDQCIREKIIPNLYNLLQHVVPYKHMPMMTNLESFFEFVCGENDVSRKNVNANIVFASRTTDGKCVKKGRRQEVSLQIVNSSLCPWENFSNRNL
jgi:hypothetical protein